MWLHPRKILDVINQPCFCCKSTIEVRVWISNYIPHKVMYLITYRCLNRCRSLSIKGGLGEYTIKISYHLQLNIQSMYGGIIWLTREICVCWYSEPNTTRQIWGIWKLRPAYSPETPNLGQNRWCFVPCDLEIWWMTLENNRASLLCCFKLCATFHSHRWLQTGVTVRKRPIWVKFDDF